MKENNLYVKLKLKKCKWKIREVRFLGIVMGSDGIKMEKQKVKAVLDYSVPKTVKEV